MEMLLTLVGFALWILTIVLWRKLTSAIAEARDRKRRIAELKSDLGKFRADTTHRVVGACHVCGTALTTGSPGERCTRCGKLACAGCFRIVCGEPFVCSVCYEEGVKRDLVGVFKTAEEEIAATAQARAALERNDWTALKGWGERARQAWASIVYFAERLEFRPTEKKPL